MKIIVKANARAKEERIEQVNQLSLGFSGAEELDVFKVSVKEPPVDGRANDAISRALAKHFSVPQSHVRLVSGARFKQKIFEILSKN